jgi:hypothetical protein
MGLLYLVERKCDPNVRKSTLWWNFVTSARFVLRYIFFLNLWRNSRQYAVQREVWVANREQEPTENPQAVCQGQYLLDTQCHLLSSPA